ncbi:MAG: glycosyltransferase [Clostridia bacterium]|nr:glycosyltransferase [Clostridia bacterium]
MVSISLCMIVKDEEAVLERCLRSVVEAVDEIIIADTGSTDRTKEIAAAFTSKIYDFEWIDDFAAARNFAFSKATMDYQFWLDADDVMDRENLDQLLKLKATLSKDTDVVMMEYSMGEKDTSALSFYRERLLRREAGFLWEGAVHEVIAPRGKILYSPIMIRHKKERIRDPFRNLRIYEKKIADRCKFTPRERYYYARELVDHRRWEEAERQLGLALREELWRVDRINALRLMSLCHRAKGDHQGALQILLTALSEEAPRGELCCAIADAFFALQDWENAAFWYELALSRPLPQDGFIEKDCYGLSPALQLCVCCYKTGQIEKAKEWNERAAQYAPDCPQVAYNRSFFLNQ